MYCSVSPTALRTSSTSGTGLRHCRPRLLAAEDDQVLGVAPLPGGQVVELEQQLELVGVVLGALGLVEHLQLPVHDGLAAVGDVEEHRVDVLQRGGLLGGLGLGEPAGELDPLVLVVLGDPPERDHAGVGDQHGDTVDGGPQPGVLLHRRRG